MKGEIFIGNLDKMLIGEANVNDADAILELQRQAYQIEAQRHNDFNISPLTQTLQELVDSFEQYVFLKATIEDSIVGSVRARSDAGTCYIGRLIVKTQFQRKGIGTALLSAIEDHFSNVRRFELFTGHKSRDNLTFYSNRGYHEFKREMASAQVTLVFMEKILSKTENSCQPRRYRYFLDAGLLFFYILIHETDISAGIIGNFEKL